MGLNLQSLLRPSPLRGTSLAAEYDLPTGWAKVYATAIRETERN